MSTTKVKEICGKMANLYSRLSFKIGLKSALKPHMALSVVLVAQLQIPSLSA